MTLAESLAAMMVEYIEGARKLPATRVIGSDELERLFEARLGRFISPDKIAQVLSEDAALQNGNLNVGFLAVKIADICEGKNR